MTAPASETTSRKPLRDRLAELRERHGRDAVRAEIDALEEEERWSRPETVAGIRAYLRADLAAWPEPFRRRLEPLVEGWSRRPSRARSAFAFFERDREDRDAWPYLRVLRSLQWLRAEAERHRGGSRARARRELERAKGSLLLDLWRFGDRRVDRARAGEAARQKAEFDLEKAARDAAQARRRIGERERLLEAGVFLSGRHRGEPLDAETRGWAGRTLARDRAALARLEPEVERLRRLLESDLATIRRRAMGCGLEGPRPGSVRE